MENNWKELSLARYRCFPDNFILSIGNKELNRDNILKEIENETETGKTLVQVEKNFLQNIRILVNDL